MNETVIQLSISKESENIKIKLVQQFLSRTSINSCRKKGRELKRNEVADLVNMKGTKWPKCKASEDGPRPV